MLKSCLAEKISERNAKIGIIGLGYVGLPLALLFVEADFEVFGYDINQDYIIVLEKWSIKYHRRVFGWFTESAEVRTLSPNSGFLSYATG